jgi:hypothetical protein
MEPQRFGGKLGNFKVFKVSRFQGVLKLGKLRYASLELNYDLN